MTGYFYRLLSKIMLNDIKLSKLRKENILSDIKELVQVFRFVLRCYFLV